MVLDWMWYLLYSFFDIQSAVCVACWLSYPWLELSNVALNEHHAYTVELTSKTSNATAEEQPGETTQKGRTVMMYFASHWRPC